MRYDMLGRSFDNYDVCAVMCVNMQCVGPYPKAMEKGFNNKNSTLFN